MFREGVDAACTYMDRMIAEDDAPSGMIRERMVGDDGASAGMVLYGMIGEGNEDSCASKERAKDVHNSGESMEWIIRGGVNAAWAAVGSISGEDLGTFGIAAGAL